MSKQDIHGPSHWDEVLDREFENESDRASVILVAALLDNALEILLKARLVPTSAAEDILFDGSNAPMGNFSARIELAYRLGLIDANFARTLHLIRRIRNDFAHNVTGCSFSDSAVASRLTELRRSTRLPERSPKARQAYVAGARGDFQLIVSWLQWRLHSEIGRTQAITSDGAVRGECPDIPDTEPGDENKPSGAT